MYILYLIQEPLNSCLIFTTFHNSFDIIFNKLKSAATTTINCICRIFYKFYLGMGVFVEPTMLLEMLHVIALSKPHHILLCTVLMYNKIIQHPTISHHCDEC